MAMYTIKNSLNGSVTGRLPKLSEILHHNKMWGRVPMLETLTHQADSWDCPFKPGDMVILEAGPKVTSKFQDPTVYMVVGHCRASSVNSIDDRVIILMNTDGSQPRNCAYYRALERGIELFESKKQENA